MSQTCRRIQDLIPLFPGGDLEDSEASLVREHVASCAACAAELGVYVAQASRFAAAATGRPRVDLWDGIQKKLAEPAPVLSFSFAAERWLRRAVAVAAGLVLGLGLLAYEKGAFRPTETPSLPGPGSGGRTVVKNLPRHDRPAPLRRAIPRLPRTIFEDDSADFHVAEQKELVPLDDDAVVPAGGTGFGLFEAEPAAPVRPAAPRKEAPRKDDVPSSERSLRF